MFVEQPFISNWAKFGRKRIKPKNKNLRGQRWNLFTHNIIFIDKHDFRSSVSRQFHGHFLLFFGLPWILISFFDNSFSVRTVFVRFSLLLASRCARDWRRGKTKSETTPCYAARPYKFGNTEQGWSWKGLREQTNHRTSYQCKKPLRNAFVWNGCHGNGKTTLHTLRKIELFFILWIIADVESVNILKLNSFSVSKRIQQKNDRVHNLTQHFNQTAPSNP